MNNNQTRVGSNWGSTPRSFQEAFPNSISGEYQSIKKRKRKEQLKSVVMVILWASVLLSLYILGTRFF